MTRWCDLSFIRILLSLTFLVEQVIQLPNEKFRPLEWDLVPVQNMSHRWRTKGPVYVDLSDGLTGKLQKSNYSKYDSNDTTSPVNTFSNRQGFMVVWKTIFNTTEVLWDYGSDYWEMEEEEKVVPAELYAQPMHEHERGRRHCSMRRKVLIETMSAMISTVGYVLYKLDDREHQHFVEHIDSRYNDPRFKVHRNRDEEEPGWRAIFNKDFKNVRKGPMRWQGPFKCNTNATMPLLVKDVDEVSQVDGELVQPNVLETDEKTDSQLFHYDHPPIGSVYAAVEIGFVIISHGDDVSLDVVPGSHDAQKFPTTNSTNHTFTVPMANGKHIRIPKGRIRC